MADIPLPDAAVLGKRLQNNGGKKIYHDILNEHAYPA